MPIPFSREWPASAPGTARAKVEARVSKASNELAIRFRYVSRRGICTCARKGYLWRRVGNEAYRSGRRPEISGCRHEPRPYFSPATCSTRALTCLEPIVGLKSRRRSRADSLSVSPPSLTSTKVQASGELVISSYCSSATALERVVRIGPSQLRQALPLTLLFALPPSFEPIVRVEDFLCQPFPLVIAMVHIARSATLSLPRRFPGPGCVEATASDRVVEHDSLVDGVS